MNSMRRVGALLLSAWAALALSACAPRLQETGPFTGEGHIEDGALVARDGARLPLRRWLPDYGPRAVVAALHGFNDYSNAFEAPATTWSARGIATYAIDQRGFGQAPHPGVWAGTEAMVQDLAALCHALRRRHPRVPLFLMGESMGGAVILAALGRRVDVGAAGAVLVAPAVWDRRHLGPFRSGILWLSAHTVPWFPVTAEGLAVTPSDNVAMLRALGRDPLVIKSTRIDAIWGLVNLMDEAYAAAAHVDIPVLLLYGTRDDIIPSEPTRETVAALGANGKLQAAFYPSGYHMLLRDLNAEIPTRDVAAWMLDPGTPIPSGADRAAIPRIDSSEIK